MGMLIFILIVALIIFLVKYNRYKEMEKWREDSRWCLGKSAYLKHVGEPYYFFYNEPPAINGDFYTKSKTEYFDSPYRKFTIIYDKCIYENTANCANCTRRSQHTQYDKDLIQKYCYGSSSLCYHVGEVDNTDYD